MLEAGDPERASFLFDSLLADRLRVLGPDHPDVLETRGHLARAVMEAGDPGRAVDLFGLVSGESVRLLGAHHPDTLIARRDYAWALIEAGAPSQAAKMLEDLLDDMVQERGEGSPPYPDLSISPRNGGEAGWRPGSCRGPIRVSA